MIENFYLKKLVEKQEVWFLASFCVQQEDPGVQRLEIQVGKGWGQIQTSGLRAVGGCQMGVL